MLIGVQFNSTPNVPLYSIQQRGDLNVNLLQIHLFLSVYVRVIRISFES